MRAVFSPLLVDPYKPLCSCLSPSLTAAISCTQYNEGGFIHAPHRYVTAKERIFQAQTVCHCVEKEEEETGVEYKTFSLKY